MAIRPIDGSELMIEVQACSWDSEQDKERAEDLVLGMTTLTPPNEPLTCEGCYYDKIKAYVHCSSCSRDKKDLYRRPPDGEANA